MKYQIYYQPDDNAYYFSEVKNNSLNYICDVEIIATDLNLYQAESIVGWILRNLAKNNFNLSFKYESNEQCIVKLNSPPKYSVDEIRMILHED
jgi:hypothetical protein